VNCAFSVHGRFVLFHVKRCSGNGRGFVAIIGNSVARGMALIGSIDLDRWLDCIGRIDHSTSSWVSFCSGFRLEASGLLICGCGFFPRKGYSTKWSFIYYKRRIIDPDHIMSCHIIPMSGACLLGLHLSTKRVGLLSLSLSLYYISLE